MISIIFEKNFKKPGFFQISLKKTEKPDPKNPGFSGFGFFSLQTLKQNALGLQRDIKDMMLISIST